MPTVYRAVASPDGIGISAQNAGSDDQWRVARKDEGRSAGGWRLVPKLRDGGGKERADAASPRSRCKPSGRKTACSGGRGPMRNKPLEFFEFIRGSQAPLFPVPSPHGRHPRMARDTSIRSRAVCVPTNLRSGRAGLLLSSPASCRNADPARPPEPRPRRKRPHRDEGFPFLSYSPLDTGHSPLLY